MKIAYLDHGKEIVVLIAGSVSTPRCTIKKEIQQLFQTCVHVYLRNSQPSHHMNSISTWVKLVFTDDEADNFSIAKFYSEFTVLIIVPILNLVNDTAPYPCSVKSAEIISFATVRRHTQKNHSHSVVPGGFAVKSYKTLEIPGTVRTASTILSTTYKEIVNFFRPLKHLLNFLLTSWGKCVLGIAGNPVMKSCEMKGRKTTERWQDGMRWLESRSKCRGINTTGNWASFL